MYMAIIIRGMDTWIWQHFCSLLPWGCFVLCSLSCIVITKIVSWFSLSLWSCEIACLQLKLLAVKYKKVKALNMWTFLKSWAIWREHLLLLLNHSFRQVLSSFGLIWGWFLICLMSEPENCVFSTHLLVTLLTGLCQSFLLTLSFTLTLQCVCNAEECVC